MEKKGIFLKGAYIVEGFALTLIRTYDLFAVEQRFSFFCDLLLNYLYYVGEKNRCAENLYAIQLGHTSKFWLSDISLIELDLLP